MCDTGLSDEHLSEIILDRSGYRYINGKFVFYEQYWEDMLEDLYEKNNPCDRFQSADGRIREKGRRCKMNLYWPVYKRIENEVIDLADTIHFSDDQLSVYSVKIADLIIRRY